jgi:Glu-tRNA(Gln) amidotransferase subunit E-like FAD-binding protein
MELDYKEVGFIAGLEIHQQLDTGKLFCRCPSYLRKDTPDFKVKRNLHVVPGETGEIDIAAQFEGIKNKDFIYEGYNDTTCLIELDEEPPKEINQEAVQIAMQISLLLNCEIIPTTQIMRKTVIDGSNTSGFQRTLLLAKNGWVETPSGVVDIWYVYLEEDAARTVERGKKSSTFRLDRLGVPLVEIVTAPDIKTPEQAKEVALHIGDLIRSCKVKRGIGTIRQDINISIKKSNRVELKGFQDPKIMIKTVNNEIMRQQKVLQKEKNPMEVRQVLPDGTSKYLRPLPGGARMYPETDLPLLKISRDQINNSKKTLPKLKSDIKADLSKIGLTEELIKVVLQNPETLDEFQTLMKVYNKNANLIAKMITLWRKDKKKVTERYLEQILLALINNDIEKEDIKDIIKSIEHGTKIEKAIKVEKASHDDLEEEISKIIKSNPGLRPNAYMGMVLSKFKGKISPQKAMEIINKLLK